MPDLWPTDLDQTAESLPITLVLAQAELLPKHTGGLVTAKVYPINSSDNTFTFNFDLVVKVLEYQFTLFTLRYGVEGYPADLEPYFKICDELGIRKMMHGEAVMMHGEYVAPPSGIQADNEASLLEALGRILGSETTKNILRTLMAEAQTFKP